MTMVNDLHSPAVQGTVKKVAILGLPNSGKSQIFNNLTGDYALVANYPLSTIDIKKGVFHYDNITYEIYDTPGLNSLYINSEEELVVRELLLTDTPDILVQCIDANRLKQSLNLTLDLIDLKIPMVLTVNALDESNRKGVWIDSDKLSQTFGIPVVESIAVDGVGTNELKQEITNARIGKRLSFYGDIIEEGISRIVSLLPENFSFKRKTAFLLLTGDRFIADSLPVQGGKGEGENILLEAEAIINQFNVNPGRIISDKHTHVVNEITVNITKRQKVETKGFAHTFAGLSRHVVFGIPILLSIILVMYLLVVNVANEIAGWMDETIWAPVQSQIDSLVPYPFWNEFLIGDYGVLSLGLANAFITVLPILSVFFLLYNVLEDIGYIPNLSVLSKKVFEKLGLSGAAIMPMVLGFGCKTMATLTAKSLATWRERYIAIFLIGFAIPCAAQMGLNMSILGKMGITAFAIAFSVLAFVEITAGLILNNVLKKDLSTSYIQELPAIRLPNIRAVLKKTYYRLYWFLKEAVPVFIYAALALFVLDKSGILLAAKSAVSPLMEGFLGLPLDMVDALILTMARHEAAAALIMNLIDKGVLNYAQCIIAVTLTTMFIPCFANIGAMVKQLGMKNALVMALIINVSAFVVAGAMNFVLVDMFGM